MKYDVLYSYKDEDIYFRCGITWAEAQVAMGVLISEGIARVDIFIRLAK